jgi:hypothetical protein
LLQLAIDRHIVRRRAADTATTRGRRGNDATV